MNVYFRKLYVYYTVMYRYLFYFVCDLNHIAQIRVCEKMFYFCFW